MIDYLNNYYPNIDLFSFLVGHTSDTLVINKINSNVNNRHPYAPPLNSMKKFKIFKF